MTNPVTLESVRRLARIIEELPLDEANRAVRDLGCTGEGEQPTEWKSEDQAEQEPIRTQRLHPPRT